MCEIFHYSTPVLEEFRENKFSDITLLVTLIILRFLLCVTFHIGNHIN